MYPFEMAGIFICHIWLCICGSDGGGSSVAVVVVVVVAAPVLVVVVVVVEEEEVDLPIGVRIIR
jgi:hypothetical protein